MTVELLKQATKRVVGNKQTAKAIQKGTAKTVYIADDADVRVVQPLLDACAEARVNVEKVATMQELGKACGTMSVQRQPRYSKVDRDLEALLKDFYNH